MNNKLLSVRQAVFWIVLSQVGSGLLLMSTALAKTAKQDAWLSVLFSLATTLLCIPIFISIANRMNGKSFVLYISSLLGKFGGRSLLCFFIFAYPFLIFILTLRDLSDFITTVISPETSSNVTNILMLVAVYFGVRSGVTVIGRSAELLFFIVVVIFIFVSVSLIYDLNIKTLLPVFEHGWKPIVEASLQLTAFPYLETILYLFFVPHLAKKGEWKKVVIQSTLISGFLYFSVVLLTVATLTQQIAANATYATYFVVRTISIAGFVERFEVLVTILWFVAIFFRLCLLMYVTILGLSEIFKLKESNMLIIPLSLIALAVSSFIWPNMAFLYAFLEVWPYYAILVGTVFPIVIWIIGGIKGMSRT